MKVAMPLGPVMLDLKGFELDANEREMLCHPLTGGVILFSRNYHSPEQLRNLTASIRNLRHPELLISVDHEGGRVQRFRSGFTRIPAMLEVGRRWPDRKQNLATAKAVGTVIAHELLEHGLDFSYTPVLDLDYGRSRVIGERAFSSDPELVGQLATALIQGLHESGSASVGKHFPGHGHVQADSHVAVPIDKRSRQQIEISDLIPYKMLVPAGLRAVMPAHVIYQEVDHLPAGFSKFWLQHVLRASLGFKGMIFSDDLVMEGASVAGSIVERGRLALDAGCDMVLVCNSPHATEELLCNLGTAALDAKRAESMRGHPERRDSQKYLDSLALLEASFGQGGGSSAE